MLAIVVVTNTILVRPFQIKFGISDTEEYNMVTIMFFGVSVLMKHDSILHDKETLVQTQGKQEIVFAEESTSGTHKMIPKWPG